MRKFEAVAIIPARGGSKRIPKKNIRPFLGEPIIKYSIDVARKCGCFGEIMVSTDCGETADISRGFGAKVPFIRSEKNSSDFATISDAMLEVVEEYNRQDVYFDNFCCIFPTVPTLSEQRILEAYTILKSNDTDIVLPVVEYEFPVQRRLHLRHKYIEMVEKENETKRSQDLSPFYHDAGRFIWVKTKALLKHRTLFLKKVMPFVLPRIIVQDIDTEEDWKIAEMKYAIENDLIKNELKKFRLLIFAVFILSNLGTVFV